jgi:hypothetical protein
MHPHDSRPRHGAQLSRRLAHLAVLGPGALTPASAIIAARCVVPLLVLSRCRRALCTHAPLLRHDTSAPASLVRLLAL